MDIEAEQQQPQLIIREGTISAVFADRYTARVNFENASVVSAELPILVPFSDKNKFYGLPQVGETAICIMEQNNSTSTTGFIIGTRYHERITPAVNNANIIRLDFSDKAFVQYDTAENTFTLQFSDGASIVYNGKDSEFRFTFKNGGYIRQNNSELRFNIKGDIAANGNNIFLNG